MRSNLAVINDEALLAATLHLLSESSATEVQLLLHLGEVDDRKLYAARGYSSMHLFCTATLNMSDSMAYDRISVARLARRLPEVLNLLRDGELNLTALRLLAPHLRENNCTDVLLRACGRSINQVKELIAELDPKSDVPDSIRKLPTRNPPPPHCASGRPELTQQPSVTSAPWPALSLFDIGPSTAAPGRDLVGSAPGLNPSSVPVIPRNEAGAAPVLPSAVCAADAPARGRHIAQSPKPRSNVEPLSPDAYKVEFTADKELKDLLETAAQLLSHRKGQRELASIVKEGVKLLIAKTKKERFGIGAAPRATKQAPPTQEETRHIPKASVRETVERDGLQCTFVADDGHRCEERSLLQLEHKEGFARTRRHTALTVLCATHNAYQADLLYGREFMDARRHRVSFQNESAPTAASIVRAASSTSAATGDSPP